MNKSADACINGSVVLTDLFYCSAIRTFTIFYMMFETCGNTSVNLFHSNFDILYDSW